jgi:lysophospholipase L1-like esterase
MKTIHRLSLGIISATILAASLAARAQTNPPSGYKFDFSSTSVTPGWTQVTPTTMYSATTGYGFEPGTLPVAVGDHALGADKPFYFSVAEPEGNYKVTVTFGSKVAPSDNTVKAELRRLMLEKIHTNPGQLVTRSFIVNVRIPQFPGGQVKLKAPRETTQELRAWDDKLTLEFNRDETNSAVSKVEIEKVDVPTIYILGDSTVCDQSGETYNSWGQMLTRWFGTGVAIANHAESGETIASSIGAKRFAKVYSLLKPGDYVLMQFGHNDMKNTTTEAYQANYVKVIGEIRAKGAIPVVIASMERSNGANQDTLKGFPAAALETAAAQKAASIDLHSMSQVFYRALGPDVKKAFNDGVTHHNSYGSYELSQMVVMGIKADKLDIAKYIVPDFKNYDPAHPDSLATFKMALSATRNAARPLGDESTFGAGATNAAPATNAPATPAAQ